MHFFFFFFPLRFTLLSCFTVLYDFCIIGAGVGGGLIDILSNLFFLAVVRCHPPWELTASCMYIDLYIPAYRLS